MRETTISRRAHLSRAGQWAEVAERHQRCLEYEQGTSASTQDHHREAARRAALLAAEHFRAFATPNRSDP